MAPLTPADLCARVDALTPPIAALGDDGAMHALMCASHEAYALFEGGGDVGALLAALEALAAAAPACGAAVRALAARVEA